MPLDRLTELQEAAAPLVPLTGLGDIRLFSTAAEFVSFPDDPEHDVEVNYDILTEAVPQENGAVAKALVVLLTVDVTLEEIDDERHRIQSLATVKVTYGALYVFKEPLDLDDTNRESMTAFARCVGAMTLWPYVRAEVARCAEAMHIPPITLPVLTQRELAEATEVDADDENPGGD